MFKHVPNILTIIRFLLIPFIISAAFCALAGNNSIKSLNMPAADKLYLNQFSTDSCVIFHK